MVMTQDSSHPTGVATTDSGGSKVTRARERKANAALELRQRSASWAEIAETLGYPTPRAALIAVEQALEAGLQAKESQEFMRMMAGKKLDELLYVIWDKATDPEHPENLSAVAKARELIADHAKLHGYTAPQELAIYSPLAKEIEQFVGSAIKAKQSDGLEQDNIFEMEADDEGVFVAVKTPEELLAEEEAADQARLKAEIEMY